MPEGSVLLLFAGAALVLFLIPGPVVLYTLARTVAQGRAAGLASVLAAAVGDFVHALGATLGLAAILASSPVAFQVVRYAGAGYLAYLGVRTLLARAAHAGQPSLEAQPLKRVFGQGVLVAVLNPKTALFFLAFLPQLLRPQRGPIALQSLVLGLLFVVMGMVMNTLWVLGASAVTRLLAGSGRISGVGRYLSAGVYLALGLAAVFGGEGG
ncbi:MAG: LysE family translocator [Chloroflexi bacterium]|nr:LysE family translocator [Chloroflexota bacterium]